MASKRIKKKREKARQINQIKSAIEQARPFIVEEDLKRISKQTKTLKQIQSTAKTLGNLGGYIAERQEKIENWRNRGAKIKYGKVKFHNSLTNMEKYHLLKRYWELVKKGWIKHDSSLGYYEDISDWALENMSNEELNDVILKAEDRKAKTSIVDFDTLTPI